ncbi:hypothetical protein [Tautonia rosea]|uniref:hypothetical protein n=1 Tax=Tautonia rosea TaxID=2728037 RepID=UPI0014763437|nr:hypothetical protein [Tautonia rosea]
MNPHAVAPNEAVEQDRQRRIAELNAEEGSDWVDRYKPGSFGCHELLDRTLILANAIEAQLLDHPSCVTNQEWYALAERAATALQELYQRIGAEHL